MNTQKRLNQIALSIGIISFVSALFFSGLNFGLAVGYKESEFFPVGYNPYQDMTIRYFMISILFLLSVVLFQARNKLFPQIIGLLLLIFVMFQCRILIASKPDEVADWITGFAIRLRLIWQIDAFLFAAAVILVTLQVYLIKLDYFSSDNYDT